MIKTWKDTKGVIHKYVKSAYHRQDGRPIDPSKFANNTMASLKVKFSKETRVLQGERYVDGRWIAVYRNA